jgi:hypothetical protein
MSYRSRHQSHQSSPGRTATYSREYVMTTPRKPAWWQLCALVPLMGGLMLLAYLAALPPGWREGVQVGIMIFIYFLVWRWLCANMYGLMNRPILDHRYDYDHHASRANGSAHSAPGLALLPDEALGWGDEHIGTRRWRNASHEE